MKATPFQKTIILSLVSVLFLICLSGCGASGNTNTSSTAASSISESNVSSFRNIPYGTKYDEANKLLMEDLKEQNYSATPTEITDSQHHYSTFRDIKLYDYNADIGLIFYNEKNTGNKEDSILTRAVYTIHNNSIEEAEICYNYFCDNLKGKYGEGLPNEYHEKNVDGFSLYWFPEGTSVSINIYRTLHTFETPSDTNITIIYNAYYDSPEDFQRIKDSIMSKEIEKNNINSGL